MDLKAIKHFAVNTLPNDKIFHWSKLKACADDKINVTEILRFVWRRVENIVGKEKMLVTSIFSFSHNVFKSFSVGGHLNSGLCSKELKKKKAAQA